MIWIFAFIKQHKTLRICILLVLGELKKSVHFAHAIIMVMVLSSEYKLKGLFLASEEIRTKVF